MVRYRSMYEEDYEPNAHTRRFYKMRGVISLYSGVLLRYTQAIRRHCRQLSLELPRTTCERAPTSSELTRSDTTAHTNVQPCFKERPCHGFRRTVQYRCTRNTTNTSNLLQHKPSSPVLYPLEIGSVWSDAMACKPHRSVCASVILDAGA